MNPEEPLESLAEGDLVSHLAQLRVGDRLVWEGCDEPRRVVKSTHGSHGIVEDADGERYQLQPSARSNAPDGCFRNLWHGEIEGLRLVSRSETPSDGDDFEPDFEVDL